MFEKPSSFAEFANRDVGAENVMIGNARGAPQGALNKGGDALRALDWSELNSRLKAARELRLLLRNDAGKAIGGNAVSFNDAAARCFRDELIEGEDKYERPVNLDVLEPRKAFESNAASTKENARQGGARETND